MLRVADGLFKLEGKAVAFFSPEGENITGL